MCNTRSYWRRLVIVRTQCGLSLIELIVVIAVLSIVLSLLVVKVGGVKREAEMTVAQASVSRVRDALLGCEQTPGLLADMRSVKGFQEDDLHMADLLVRREAWAPYDPVARRGWRGPYMRSGGGVMRMNSAPSGRFPAANDRRWQDDKTFRERRFYADDSSPLYGTTNHPAIADPWGNPIVLQVPTNDFSHARVVSAGPSGVMDTPPDIPMPSRESRGDDIVLFLYRPDEI
jgi:prepilin-type N-terminal cleavage/methylation domain-containing protein